MATPKTLYPRSEEKVILPRAPQKFPALDKPDTSTYALGKCPEGVYKTTALYKANSPFIKELTKKLDAVYAKGVAEVAKLAATMPTTNPKEKAAQKAFATIQAKNDYFKADTDKEGNDTGYVQVNVKLNVTTAKGVRNSFVLIDSKRNPLPRTTAIWGGTEAIIQAKAKFYNVAGLKQSGISFELLGIQVLNLVGPNGSRDAISANDFEEEEGFVADDNDGSAPATGFVADDNDGSAPATGEVADEDVPF